jgi:hypothetical protein
MSAIVHVGGMQHNVHHTELQEGYVEQAYQDGPLRLRVAVREDLVGTDGAAREIRRAVAFDHDTHLMGKKGSPRYGSPEAVAAINIELTKLWMQAEFLGVVMTVEQVPLKPLAMGHFQTIVRTRARDAK